MTHLGAGWSEPENVTLKNRKRYGQNVFPIREAFKKKNWIFNDIDQIGGRGSEKKPNFMKVEK